MNFITIPVRLESSRFPNKVIQDIHGKSVMQWIWESASQVVGADNVFFNTPNEELVEFAKSFGALSVQTKKYNCVLDQCAEAVFLIMEQNPNKRYDSVTVIQGDEPMVSPETIWKSISAYSPYSSVSNCLYKKITLEEAKDVNTVKCVLKDVEGHKEFVYLSRSIVPGTTPEKYGKQITDFYKQVCIFTFNVYTLSAWWANTPMESVEASEGIDLVRFIQNGKRVMAVESTQETHAIDVPADLELVRELMKDVV